MCGAEFRAGEIGLGQQECAGGHENRADNEAVANGNFGQGADEMQAEKKNHRAGQRSEEAAIAEEEGAHGAG